MKSGEAYRLGIRAEALCKILLIFKGYSIIAKRYKTPVGEIDLIAVRGDVLAFVEVKARPDMAQAAESISLWQRKRIARAAQYFCLRHGRRYARHHWRFDAMLVAPWRWPQHLEAAWMENGMG